MARKGSNFKYESFQDGETLVEYLEALADGFSRGSLQLASDGESVLLEPQGLLRFRVKAQRGTYRSRLIIKVSWREGLLAPDSDPAPLRVSSPPPQE